MRICMVLHDPQEFGGLEEYAVSLAIGLQRLGQQVSVLSTTWVPKDNQYVCRLLANNVTYVQVPKWLSRPASHWPTKQKILKALMWVVSPLTFLFAVGLLFKRRAGWRQAWASANGWLCGQIQYRFIVPNRYQSLTRLLLNWWRWYWRPDVLHIQGYTSTLLFVIEWAHARKIPVVYEEHQTPDPQFNWWQGFQQSINKATTVVAVSETSAQALREVCSVTRPIVVRPPLLPDPVDANGSNHKMSVKTDRPFHITTMARLVEPKGLTYLLDAIVKVKSHDSSIQFRVYGNGPLREDLLAYAAQRNLDGREIFPGAFTSRSELSSIMAETDVFVMSSILEGQPLAVIEAMAYGLPIVATSVGGIPEVIQDGVNGMLCSPRDSDCLAQKILKLLGDLDLRAQLGAAARKSYVSGPFQPVSLSKLFVSVYENAVLQKIAV